MVLSLIGLGVSDSLSPSISVVPGSDSSRAQTLSDSEFGPSLLVPILIEGPAAQLDRQGPKLVVALSRRADTRVMSAWSTGESGRALRPRPDAAMIVASVAKSEAQMVKTVHPPIERTVNTVLSGQVKAHITGQATLDRALKDEAISTTREAELIAVGGLFVLLLIGLRTIALPLVAVAFDALTILATFGAMTLLFGGGDPLLGGPGYLDPMSIIGIFAAIFGISIAYEVLLLARTREHFAESGDASAALAFGLRRTAAVATGAAAVMVVAALPFVFSDLINVRQFGVGLAIAVVLDALVVRPILLPAAVQLLGRRSWWPTAPHSIQPTAPGGAS